MKTGDAIEYYNRGCDCWFKGRYVGNLSDGDHVIEAINGVTYIRKSEEVRIPKVKVTRWVNVYRYSDGQTSAGGNMFHSELVAISEGKSKPNIYLATVSVTWEE